MSYESAWQGGWIVVCATVLGFSLLMWDPVTVASVFAVIALLGAAVWTAAVPPATPASGFERTLAAWWRAVPGAALLTAALFAVYVLAVVSPGVAALVALVAIGSSPWFVRRWSAQRDPEPRAENETDTEIDTIIEVETAEAPSLDHLNDAQLCQVWRCSYPRLMAAESTAERLDVVALRHAYLDEMDRRNSPALERWLASGARAAGAPDRYLLFDPPPGQSAA